MTESERRDVWRGIVRGIVILASLAMAAFHFLLVEWNRGMLAFGAGRRMSWYDYWFDHYGYCILATVLLLLPWLQPWTGYVALLIAAMSFAFGVWGLFPEGVGLPYLGYGLVILFGFWQLVGFRRSTARDHRRGLPLD